MTKIRVFFVILLLFFLITCKNETNRIPYVAVNFTISLEDPLANPLLIPGNSVIIESQGVNGIIIYRFSQTDFLAWERTCTYLPEDNCAVVSDSSSHLNCPCCGTQYSIIDGSPIQGLSRYFLKSYNTSFDGRILRVYN